MINILLSYLANAVTKKEATEAFMSSVVSADTGGWFTRSSVGSTKNEFIFCSVGGARVNRLIALSTRSRLSFMTSDMKIQIL